MVIMVPSTSNRFPLKIGMGANAGVKPTRCANARRTAVEQFAGRSRRSREAGSA